MKQLIAKATTDVTLYVFVQDSSATDGSGLTSLVYNSAGLTASYVRPLAARAAITLATQTVTGAHSDGGFVEVDATNCPGLYRFDLPDAVCATGVDSVIVTLNGATNMAPVNIEIQLTNLDVNDGVRAGLTALPNAAADAAGGLPISDAGGLDLDAKIGALTFTTANKVDCRVDNWAGAAVTLSATTNKPQVDVDSIDDDATAADNAELFFDGTGYAGGTTKLDINVASHDDGVLGIIRRNTAQAGASTTITLDAGASASDNFYNDRAILIVSGTGAGQHNEITAYVGATKVATVGETWGTTPDATSVFEIRPKTVADVHSWANTGVSVSASTQLPSVSADAISDDATAANNLEADYDGTGYNKSNSTIGTCTANTDMRGTDSAATATAMATAQLDLDTLTGADGVTLATSQPNYAPATAAALATVDTNIDTLLTRITSTLFSGITSLAEWLGLLGGKQTGDATALTEIKATGAGAGTYDPTTDSLEAVRDHVGNGTNLTEAGGTGDHLTAISLPDQTMNITGNITGNVSGSVGSVTGGVNTSGGTITTLDGLDTAQDTQHASTQSLVTTVDTVVDAIKVITDAIGATAAANLAKSCGAAGIVAFTAQTGTLSTTQATTDLAETTDDHYIGRTVIWITGALAGQATDITDSSGTGGLLTFTALTEAPTNGDTGIIV